MLPLAITRWASLACTSGSLLILRDVAGKSLSRSVADEAALGMTTCAKSFRPTPLAARLNERSADYRFGRGGNEEGV